MGLEELGGVDVTEWTDGPDARARYAHLVCSEQKLQEACRV